MFSPQNEEESSIHILFFVGMILAIEASWQIDDSKKKKAIHFFIRPSTSFTISCIFSVLLVFHSVTWQFGTEFSFICISTFERMLGSLDIEYS